MVNVKRGHKLCLKCKRSYKKKCTSNQCKCTIENYRSASKYMKNKTINYLKENNMEFYLCKICGEIVNKSHFDSEEHIQKFHSVCKINIKKSLENSFLTIECKFIDTIYNYIYIYSDLHFKKYIREIVLKKIDNTKFYKSYIIKKILLDFNYKNEKQYYSEKYNSNNIISDINNIEKLEKNDDILQPFLIKNNTTDYKYNLDKMYDDIDRINCIKSGNSITYINNMGCNIKITECELLHGNRFNFEKIPKIFYDSKVISVIKTKMKNALYIVI